MEIAGVVLSALPLLINGLTGIAQAAGTFDRLKTPGKQLRRYARSLKREETLYRNTLTELLDGIVCNDDELQEMLLDTGSHLWVKHDLALRRRLGRSYEPFVNTVEDIEDELKTLIDDLKVKTGSASTQKVSPKSILIAPAWAPEQLSRMGSTKSLPEETSTGIVIRQHKIKSRPALICANMASSSVMRSFGRRKSVVSRWRSTRTLIKTSTTKYKT